ncbi:type II 3-dehydroquinate dehydratase [Pseudoalteromonas sp. McH1-7]|uniref:3-dehydroquinate dehydratase n=1 Tax=Pseudoalteromonas peptidolytica F12-50-A1 TaxID=1315280 RepID=A0A8I0T4P6_9GAMM|nr:MULTISPECIES: type II 3-dehydroquinate dehydratase [Pseudoalteromonas]MBE0347205.1 3-dehydroquinate dehydratase II [Pseudoalteromonas peptidolytica F12-50-A1]MDW7549338.1 type II 3-dehydroquinate dehydratase [Pseudoalteromonas peptidolytica]NLR13847.1 type II 3-dehydroquinate dehydratase [Pseudoalteromonas peptidolytica]NUZ10450.1 type II 3-dehydroquinate dehydratase [Pseudoalteromonas sp. McH1-7]USD28997.1 type II 3-dehydroquinate dehydratase [Pseudoalteromonas sp. SCSIO 43201]
MSAKLKILLVNGPNLNMLGRRETSTYGTQTLNEIVDALTDYAQNQQVELSHIQSNSEAELIEAIHAQYGQCDAIIINPAAFTHTSIALRDALLSVDIPFYEVHITNVHKREPFRRKSYFSDVAEGVICGLGALGYRAALDAALAQLRKQNNSN